MEKENSSKNNQIPSGTTPRSNPKKCISKKDLTNLDEFIQNCLDKFKFIDPKEEFYEATGDEKDLIISHKSTIPDLVIWNKVFNKNECFIESNNKKMNSFPRFQFYLRIKSNKPEKDKKKEKKNKKNQKNKKKEKKNQSNNNNTNNNNIIVKEINFSTIMSDKQICFNKDFENESIPSTNPSARNNIIQNINILKSEKKENENFKEYENNQKIKNLNLNNSNLIVYIEYLKKYLILL